jgi:hypothetical protein
MRSLHRDIGFFIIGLTIIYCISGIVLVFRDTTVFKIDALVEKEFDPHLEMSELGKKVKLKDFQVLKTEGDIVYFQTGIYNKVTGVAKYISKENPVLIKKFHLLHRKSSKDHLTSRITRYYGMLLFFMAISSFWMFNPKTKLFRRGIWFAASGILLAMILVIMVSTIE